MSAFQDKFNFSGSKILISPLNWGLGHASRLIPVISFLISRNNQVILFGESPSIDLLSERFPDLKLIRFRPLKITYSKGNNQILRIFLQLPFLILHTITEHLKVKRIVKKNAIDLIISDNRYGIFCKGIQSIIITHQTAPVLGLAIKFPEKIINFLLIRLINKFSICFIPDFEGKENLSGDLSHRLQKPENYRFIGPITHLNDTQALPERITFKYLAILSGPEPHRSIFEQKLKQLFEYLPHKCAIISGRNNVSSESYDNKTVIFPRLSSGEIEMLISESEIIICRSGYSGIMDLYRLQKTKIIVPTPGQPEQEYLAQYLHGRYGFIASNLQKLELK